LPTLTVYTLPGCSKKRYTDFNHFFTVRTRNSWPFCTCCHYYPFYFVLLHNSVRTAARRITAADM